MSAEAVATILKSDEKGEALTTAINKAIEQHGQPKNGFNTKP